MFKNALQMSKGSIYPCDQYALGCPEMGVQLGGLGERETVVCSLTSLSSNALQDGRAWSFLHVQCIDLKKPIVLPTHPKKTGNQLSRGKGTQGTPRSLKFALK